MGTDCLAAVETEPPSRDAACKFLDKGIPSNRFRLFSTFPSVTEPLRLSSFPVDLSDLVYCSLSRAVMYAPATLTLEIEEADRGS